MKKIFALILLMVMLSGCSFFGGLGAALDSDNYDNVEINSVITIKEGSLTSSVEVSISKDGDTVYSYTDLGSVKMHTYTIEIDKEYYLLTKMEGAHYPNNWNAQKIMSNEDIEDLEEELKAVPEMNKNDFEKDEEGFYVLKEEKSQEYIDLLLDSFKQYMTGATIDDFTLKIEVKNNRISTMFYEVEFTVADTVASIACEMTYTNIGKTKVELPSDAKEELDSLVNTKK